MEDAGGPPVAAGDAVFAAVAAAAWLARACRRSGRYNEEVPDEHSGRALRPRRAGRAVARVLGPGRDPDRGGWTACWWREASAAQARQALENVGELLAGAGGSGGTTW